MDSISGALRPSFSSSSSSEPIEVKSPLNIADFYKIVSDSRKKETPLDLSSYNWISDIFFIGSPLGCLQVGSVASIIKGSNVNAEIDHEKDYLVNVTYHYTRNYGFGNFVHSNVSFPLTDHSHDYWRTKPSDGIFDAFKICAPFVFPVVGAWIYKMRPIEAIWNKINKYYVALYNAPTDAFLNVLQKHLKLGNPLPEELWPQLLPYLDQSILEELDFLQLRSIAKWDIEHFIDKLNRKNFASDLTLLWEKLITFSKAPLDALIIALNSKTYHFCFKEAYFLETLIDLLPEEHWEGDDKGLKLSEILSKKNKYLASLDSQECLHFLRHLKAKKIYLADGIKEHRHANYLQNLPSENRIALECQSLQGEVSSRFVDKKLLESNSPFLEDVLVYDAFSGSQLSQSGEYKIQLEEVCSEALHVCLLYLETGQLDLTNFHEIGIHNLLHTAEFLQVDSFKDAIISHLKESIEACHDRSESEHITININDKYCSVFENEIGDMESLLLLCDKYHLDPLRESIDNFVFFNYENKEFRCTEKVVMDFVQAVKYGLEKTCKHLNSNILASFENLEEEDEEIFHFAILQFYLHGGEYWPKLWLEASKKLEKYPGWLGKLWEAACDTGDKWLIDDLKQFCLSYDNYPIAIYNDPLPEKKFV